MPKQADFGTFLLDSFIPAEVWSNPIVRYGSLIPSLALFIFGAALYMTVELGVSPFDALPFIIEKYLPKQMSIEELEVELKVIIAQVGATSPKDMGKVMGIASKALAGKAEGRAISEAVKRLLSE